MTKLVQIVLILEFSDVKSRKGERSYNLTILIFAGLGVTSYVLILLPGVLRFPELEISEPEPDRRIQAFSNLLLHFVLTGIIFALTVPLAFLLHMGVKNRSLKLVNGWFWAQVTLLFIGMIFFEMFSHQSAFTTFLALTAYRIWTLCVVSNFLTTLGEEEEEVSNAPFNSMPESMVTGTDGGSRYLILKRSLYMYDV